MNNAPYFAVDPLPETAVAEQLGLWHQAQECLPHARLYALIDAAFDESACADYLGRRNAGDSISLYEGILFEDLGGISPWLVKLDVSARDRVTSELEKLRLLRGNRPMLSFVASALDLPDLQRHFRPFVRVVVQDDLPLLLRFADTRIIDPLFEVLTVAQKAAFVPPEMGLWFPRRKGGSVGGLLPKVTRPHAAALKQLHLDGAQFGALLDAGDADLIIQALTTTDSLRFDRMRPSDVHAFMARQIDRARIHGLKDKPNLEIYCTTAWATGPEFDRHPEFAYAIQRASRAPGQLAALVNEVSDAAWDAAALVNTSRDRS